MYNNIYPKIVEIVADVLMVDEAEIQLNKRLIKDLGAESIDFLDLIFQMEKAFSIKIPRGKIEKMARNNLTEEEFEKDGVITPKGLQELKKYLSEVPEECFVENLKVAQIPTLFTVETLCKLVEHSLSEINIDKKVEA